MKCFVCGRGKLEKRLVTLTGDRNDEEFTVSVNGLACSECDFETIDNDQSGEFTRLVSDAYRQKHGLLTGLEIRAAREQLRMSQRQFADYLGVGSASVKRWELGQIQDRAMDKLMRLMSDAEEARRNYLALVPEFAAQAAYVGYIVADAQCPQPVIKYCGSVSDLYDLRSFKDWPQKESAVC